MARPTTDEIIAEIYRLADAKGIDRDVLLETITKESSLNPAAKGDIDPKTGQPMSGGLAQLFTGGGLGNDALAQGIDPFNPDQWKEHLNFMTDQIVGGGKGLEPWHAWKGSPDAWKTGAPSTAAATPPPSRGRGGQVMPMTQVQATPGQGQAQGDQGLLAELKRMMEPKHNTLLARGLTAAGVNLGDNTTLGGLVGDAVFGKTGNERQVAKAQDKLTKENRFSATETNTDKLAKKKVNVPLLSLFTNPEQDPNKPKTIGQWAGNGISSLFG
jgi:hypothetical protein